ncbi:MAG: Uma2 family endonuclease [Anaerolineae bacterium]
MAVQVELVTAEMLAALPDTGERTELVRGEVLVMAPAGEEHGELTIAIGAAMYDHVRQHRLGRVYGAETGFVLSREPDTVRAPDAAFVAAHRLADRPRRSGFFDGAPDLAVEVVSPNDSYQDVEDKVHDYLNAGTRAVWVVNPRAQIVTVYEPSMVARRLTVNDTLDGGDTLPGFALPIGELFEIEM